MNYKDLYHDLILEHYNHPRNKGVMNTSDISSGAYNPSCGDSVSIQASVENSSIDQCKFQVEGCVISAAATSLLVDACIGLSLDSVLALDKEFILDLIKIPLGPTRLRCALLVLEALQNGIKKYQQTI